jgi:hypothetical protein
MTCSDSDHAPDGAIAYRKNDGKLVRLAIARYFQFFHLVP